MNPTPETTPPGLDRLTGPATDKTSTNTSSVEWGLSPAQVAFRVTLLLVIWAIGLMSNALNGLMLLKSKRPSTAMHILMFNLVVVDMSMSVTCIPLSVLFSASNGSIDVPDDLCKVSAYLLQTLTVASLLTQSAISVIRTVAITFPEAIQQRLPPSTAYKITICIWLQASLTPLLPFLSHDQVVDDRFTYRPRYMTYTISDSHTKVPQAVIFSVVSYLIPLAIICISYIILYVSLRRHLKKNFLVQDRSSKHMYTVQMRVQVRVGLLVVFVVTSTAFIWVPFYIMTCISLFEMDQFETLSRNTSAVLIFGSASVNPMMYGFMNTSLRQDFKSYMAAKHPKLLARISRLCCRCCCKKKSKVDAAIVIPREQIPKSFGQGNREGGLGPGSISGQLVVQINHEINLKHQSVFSLRHPPDPGETHTDRHQQRETVIRGARPPLIKRSSWSQSLAHNARRFSDKVSRRRSGSDSASDDRRQLPLLDLKAVSQLHEESHQNTRDVWTFPKDQEKLDSRIVFDHHTDETKHTFHNLSRISLSPKTKRASSGHKDGSVVAVSQCFKKKPVFGDIVKVRRVFIEQVTLVPGYKQTVTGEAEQGVGVSRSQSFQRESVSSVDSQLFARTTVKTSGDIYATMTVQLPGCIQSIPEK